LESFVIRIGLLVRSLPSAALTQNGFELGDGEQAILEVGGGTGWDVEDHNFLALVGVVGRVAQSAYSLFFLIGSSFPNDVHFQRWSLMHLTLLANEILLHGLNLLLLAIEFLLEPYLRHQVNLLSIGKQGSVVISI
jgi:hypothetical protein